MFKKVVFATFLALAAQATAKAGGIGGPPVSWSFLNNDGGPATGSLISGTIEGLVDGVNAFDPGSTPAITVNLLTSQNGATGVYSAISGSTGSITLAGGAVTDYNFTLFLGGANLTAVLNNSAYIVYNPGSPTGSDTYFGVGNIFPSGGASVPGPLPLLGASAAFGWSRRLRRRVAVSPVTAAKRVDSGSRG